MNEIELLLQSGADVNTKDKNEFTLLMSFVKKKDLETVKILLQYGAKSSSKDHSGFSALDYAIKNNDMAMVMLLVHNGTHISNENYMLAIESNRKEIVNFFDTFDPDKEVFLQNKIK